MARTRGDRIVRPLERGLWLAGIVCLVWVGLQALRAVAYQAARAGHLVQAAAPPAADRPGNLAGAPLEAGAPIGRLRIPRLGLSVAVVEGDDDDTLEVAVGHLPDTPLPWAAGNAALAGHRDTFFRPLRHVRVGDQIEFDTPRGTLRYRVTDQKVVAPDDLSVLRRDAGALTLITCYPFNFVGPAPRRLAVHAERIDTEPAATWAREWASHSSRRR